MAALPSILHRYDLGVFNNMRCAITFAVTALLELNPNSVAGGASGEARIAREALKLPDHLFDASP